MAVQVFFLTSSNLFVLSLAGLRKTRAAISHYWLAGGPDGVMPGGLGSLDCCANILSSRRLGSSAWEACKGPYSACAGPHADGLWRACSAPWPCGLGMAPGLPCVMTRWRLEHGQSKKFQPEIPA